MTTKRRVRWYNKWRCDSDYKNQLSPEDAAWLDTFEREFYCGERLGLHPEEYRKDLHDATNAAARDIVTASSKDIGSQLKLVNNKFSESKDPSKISRWYHPTEYVFEMHESEMPFAVPTSKKGDKHQV